VIETASSTTEDLFAIDLQVVQLEDVKELGHGFQLMVDQSSDCETLRDRDSGRIIAIVGMVLARAGCGSVWSLVSRDVGRNGVSLTRSVRRLIERTAEQFELRRMDMLVREDQKAHIAWAMHFGFLNETPYGIKNFGPNGETYLLMARYW
jgi:hypothetical protein